MKAHRPLYRVVLADALTMTWKNRYLWPLGFFAGMLLSGSAYDLLTRSWNVIVGTSITARYGISLVDALADAAAAIGTGTDALSRLPWGVFVVMAVLLAFSGFLVWVSIVSQGSLLSALAAEEERKRPNLQTFFLRGFATFWPVLAVNVLVRVAVGVAVLLVSALLVPAARASDLSLAIGAVVAFILLIPAAYASIVAGFFTALGVVRFKEPLGQAIQGAARLIARNWLVVLETTAVLLLIDVAVAAVTGLFILVITIPFFLLLPLVQFAGSTIAFWAILSVYLLLAMTGILAVAAATVTYHYAVWTLLAERLRKGPTTFAKIVRVFHALGFGGR